MLHRIFVNHHAVSTTTSSYVTKAVASASASSSSSKIFHYCTSTSNSKSTDELVKQLDGAKRYNLLQSLVIVKPREQYLPHLVPQIRFNISKCGWNIAKASSMPLAEGNLPLSKLKEYMVLPQVAKGREAPYVGMAKQVYPNAVHINKQSDKLWVETTCNRLIDLYKAHLETEDAFVRWRVHIGGRSEHHLQSLVSAITNMVSTRCKPLHQLFCSSPTETTPYTKGDVLVQLLFTGKDTGYVSIATPPLMTYFQKTISRLPSGAIPEFSDRLKERILKHQGTVNQGGGKDGIISQNLPSRSYLKLAELAERFPDYSMESPAGGVAIDLGASPGGWSLFALEQGCRVVSIDKAQVFDKRLDRYKDRSITIQGDALEYEPPKAVDWLLCDMKVPARTSIELLSKWLQQGWCDRFIVTLKFEGTMLITSDIEKLIKDTILPHTQYFNAHSLDNGGKEVNLFGTRKINKVLGIF
ncbi:hypothetical protein DFA_00714 [Cavenderia fasciculata]|uniref:Ribosomal RNA methyltransferase FtsJ domain-containing protein n=1 Tax=Cavenderia fasciculata TaxID=261658 RepID=F4PTG7_CACFS|nr:uncharacterized protein DFA_00714 [Cavenderia fasciculata]EGG20849.1 hypothetical protein DFA_00714 [Cavenderia fasciculata]|eukprot:XP_004358699.1 hypothetical protein DFA_00714 [Cavenderia fasciculata]